MRRLQPRATPQVSGARRVQVTSDFNPASISCGCRVSCAKALLVDGVSRQVGGGARRELDAHSAGNELAPRGVLRAPDFIKESVNSA